MRRSVKVAALASAATLLAIGASMTSFAAARGWTQEDGEWVWLDSNGDKATETFKLSGNTYYWLNSDGYLGCDELVEYNDYKYYVDETGAMVRNQWRELDNTEDDDEFEDTVWYYFQASGKAYESGKKSINGQSYIFNEDGKMLFGWVNDDYTMADKDDEDSTEWKEADYYCGEANDGAVVTNAWRQIRVHDESPYLKDNADDSNDDDYDYWFYFGSNGKKYKMSKESADKETEYKEKTIGGKKYAFAADGHMASEWTAEEATAGTGVKYFSDPENGARLTKGWFKVVPSSALDSTKSEDDENEEQWYYANNSGKLIYNQIKSINGKKYLFNEAGECKAGLWWIEFEDYDKELGFTPIKSMTQLDADDSTEGDLDAYTDLGTETLPIKEDSADGMYYFAKPLDTNAVMQTGNATISIDGDNYNFKFLSSGQFKGKGWNGVKDGAYYVNGRKVKADSDDKYVLYKISGYDNKKITELEGGEVHASNIDAGNGEHYAVISSTGVLTKSGTKKDGDDFKLTVKNYQLVKVTTSDDTKNPIWEVDGDQMETWFDKIEN